MENYLKSYQGKTILITGGAGCIGSNLAKTLLGLNPKKIIILDDLSSAQEWNIPKDPRVVFIKGDVLDDNILKKTFANKPEIVFHFAALFANQNSIDHPEKDLMVNGLGILKMLEHSRDHRVERMVYSSSGCSVYGSQAPLPLKEDFVSIHLDTPYMITKLLGELYANFFYHHYQVPIVCTRFFNVYGPGEIPGQYRNVIPNFTYWAMKGRPLPITGTGEETRDFTFVDDIIDGVLRAGYFKEAIGEAMNLASSTETKIIDIAKKINQLTNNKAGIEYKERRDWDKISKRRASVEKAKKIIGYQPKTKFDDGLKMVVEWIKANWQKIEKDAKFNN